MKDFKNKVKNYLVKKVVVYDDGGHELIPDFLEHLKM